MENLGGKGNNLILLKEEGLPVPDFTIIKNTDLLSMVCPKDLDLLYNRLSKENYSKDDQDEITKIIMNLDIDPLIKDVANYKWDKETVFAVRSSISMEDGQNASWAGIFDSFLNVDCSEIEAAIKRCWASAFTVNAYLYCTMVQKRPFSSIEANVIVQEMVNSRISGVAFSKNPAGDNDDGLLIEYVEGEGEKLVSGHVNPKRVSFDCRDSFSEESVPFPLKDLASGLLVMEKKLGCLVDIEWAWDGSTLYFLQVRPITA